MGVDPAVLRTSWWTSCFVGCMQALKEGFLADGREVPSGMGYL